MSYCVDTSYRVVSFDIVSYIVLHCIISNHIRPQPIVSNCFHLMDQVTSYGLILNYFKSCRILLYPVKSCPVCLFFFLFLVSLGVTKTAHVTPGPRNFRKLKSFNDFFSDPVLVGITERFLNVYHSAVLDFWALQIWCNDDKWRGVLPNFLNCMATIFLMVAQGNDSLCYTEKKSLDGPNFSNLANNF